jgi:hypothetical protein
MSRRLLWTLIALVAVSVFVLWAVPAAPARVGTAGWDDLAARTAAGAYHVHTTRSDGHGDKAAVADAAAKARLAFVILTDHGDGTRPPDPPEYIHGVLMLDAVEISTDDGHYVALDMPRAPYPLGGAGETVVEDVHRLGGFGIAAHPDSPKAALRWTAPATAPIDGIEWLNADSEWRDETRGTLARAGLTYFFRPAGSLATLLDRPSTLERWDTLLRTRRLVGLAAADAHGGAGRGIEDSRQTFFSRIGIPNYEASFRELSVRAVLERPLSGTAAEDARAVYGAIRKGRVFSVIDALASPALLDIHAIPSGATVTIAARATLPSGAELVLIGPDGEIGRGTGELRREVPAERPAAYRVEVRLGAAVRPASVPWLVSNPLYVGELGSSLPAEPAPVTAPNGQFPWRIEKDAASSAILRTPGASAELEYHLADGARASQFVALATDLHAQTFTAIDLALVADRPTRLAVQVRTADGRRWGRSYYVDPAGTAIHAALSDFRAIGAPAVTPPAESVDSILLVADLTNANPGRSGHLVVRSAELVK